MNEFEPTFLGGAEQIQKLVGKVPEGVWRRLAHKHSADFDDKYGQDFREVELAIKKENNE